MARILVENLRIGDSLISCDPGARSGPVFQFSEINGIFENCITTDTHLSFNINTGKLISTTLLHFTNGTRTPFIFKIRRGDEVIYEFSGKFNDTLCGWKVINK